MARLKTCKAPECENRQPRDQMLGPMKEFCSVDCGYALASHREAKRRQKQDRDRQKVQARVEAVERKRRRERKEALKSRADHLKEAQREFNRYIRLRDHRAPCISCQRHHQGQYHAGHYRTVGGNPELRFDEDNCHKQCSACNNHMSGNIANYRIYLIRKIGEDAVDKLEGPHPPLKLTIEEIQEIKTRYRRLANELQKTLGG